MGGSLGTAPNAEIWVCGVRVVEGAQGFLTNPQAYVDAVQAGVSAWFTTNPGSRNLAAMRNDATLQWLKAANIGSDGKYHAGDPVGQHNYSPAIVGPLNPGMPPFVTLALSWTTPLTRGVGSHGRIYPPVAVAASTSGILPTTGFLLADYATLGVTLIRALNQTAAGTYGHSVTCSVITRQGGKIPGGGAPITGCRVGSIVDVQRRRKDKLRDTYVGTTV